MLKYGCRSACCAEILPAGGIFSISWTSSSVRPGSCFNLRDTGDGLDQPRPPQHSPEQPRTCRLLQTPGDASKHCNRGNVCRRLCSRLAC